MWSALPKTQRRVVTLCYSPCEDTPNAASHRISNDSWSIAPNLQKYFFVVSILLLMEDPDVSSELLPDYCGLLSTKIIWSNAHLDLDFFRRT